MASKKESVGSERRARVLVLLAWYATGVFRGVARVAQEYQWIMDSSYERSGEIPLDWKGDGVIAVLGVDAAVDAYVEQCGLPVVNIGYSKQGSVPQVMADQEAVARLAAEHFVVRGFRNIAYYLRSGRPGDRGRWLAFRAALEAKGVEALLIDGAAVMPDGSQSGRQKWLARELSALPKPLGVIAEIDDYAIELVDAAVDAGIAIPRDLAVLGVGNDELRCPFAAVPLSSVDDNPHGIGDAAAKLLDGMMRKKRAPKEPMRVPPLGVVTRRSTDILAVEHPLVALALQEVRKNFLKPLTAEGMVAGIAMSRRRLHDAFVRLIGHSVADEVTRLRMNYAKKLLAETEMKHHQIAKECGLRSESGLSVVFLREVGMTPGEYRGRFNPLFSQRPKVGRPGGS